MRTAMGLVLVLTACGVDSEATPDAAVPMDAADSYLNAFDLVDCMPNWSGAPDAPWSGVKCQRACADHSAIGHGGACIGNATTYDTNGQVNDLFQCTAGTATTWNGYVGCCLIQPEFAHLNTDPPLFAMCDSSIPN